MRSSCWVQVRKRRKWRSPVSTEGKPEPVRETATPSGIDLRPQPEKSPRISGRAAGLIVLTGVAVLGLFAYGGLRRRQQQAVAAEGSPYKKVEPARSDEVRQLSPAGSAGVRTNAGPGSLPAAGDDPNQSQHPDSDLPKARIVVRRSQTPHSPPPVAQPPI